MCRMLDRLEVLTLFTTNALPKSGWVLLSHSVTPTMVDSFVGLADISWIAC